MTDEERESLNYHAARISYKGLKELAKFVEGLLEAEFQYGYDSGWGDSSRTEGAGTGDEDSVGTMNGI